MEYKIDVNSPLNSLKEATVQLSTNKLSKFVVNCDRSFFQTLIDTKEFDIAYKYYASMKEPTIDRFRTFEVDNFYFIEDLTLKSGYAAVMIEQCVLNDAVLNFTLEKVIVTQQEFEDIIEKHKDEYTYYTTNQQPVINFIDFRNYDEWFVVGNKIYVVPKNKFDFSKYDYLPDMADFMEDIKYMFENHNSPNDYPFTKVQLAFDRMFEKGVVQAEEVKNGLGETFQSFMTVWIESYSLMVGKECQLKDFFKAIEEGLYVKDILPFVAKVVKEKYTH